MLFFRCVHRERSGVSYGKMQQSLRSVNRAALRVDLKKIIGDSPRWESVLTEGKEWHRHSTVMVIGRPGRVGADRQTRIHPISTEGGVLHKANCAAFPLTVESETFGHERGAVTGAVLRKWALRNG